MADNGKGISDKDKLRIFDRFYKADESRSKDGNGSGLAIVKKIVELSSGKFSLKDSRSSSGIPRRIIAWV
nr:HAMP domain-containing sensor histidine kinase [Desulfosporosinus lacus]